MIHDNKKVSIIVLSWFDAKYLDNCFSSLEKIDYRPLEIIVIIWAKNKEAKKLVEKKYPKIKLLIMKESLGYAGCNNYGIENSDGEYILILNNDVEVKPDFLSILVKRLESDLKIGCVQPKLVEHNNRNLLDSAGHFLTDAAFLYHYGRLKEQSLPIYNQVREIYCAKGAAMLFPRRVLAKIAGAFDPDFFIYFEETDFCHRLWLAGYKVIYEPKAVIYHVVAGDTSREFTSDWTLYLSLRNRICSFIKCYEAANLVKYLIVLLGTYFGLALFYLLTFKFLLVKAIVGAVGWNLQHLLQTLEKRTFVQQKVRKVSDKAIFKRVKHNPHPIYYFYLFRNSLGKFVDAALS